MGPQCPLADGLSRNWTLQTPYPPAPSLRPLLLVSICSGSQSPCTTVTDSASKPRAWNSRPPAGHPRPPQARSSLLQNRKCRTPERSPSPPRAPKRAAWRISTRGRACAAFNPAQGSEYETVTAASVGDTAPEGRVLVAEHCIHAQLLGARRDPGWSGVSWAGIWGPRGDPVSGPPPYICSLRWAVWMAVWGYEVPL